MMTMSGATVSGSSLTNYWTLTSGATPVFTSYFNSISSVTISPGGESTVPGAVAFFTANGSDTLSGSTITDQSTGGNSVTTLNPATIFAAPNDTISSAAASTVFGAGSGITHFMVSGANSSITGGAGGTVGTVSGANSTLVGGSGNSIFHVTGANSEAVAGPGPGITGIDESQTTGPENIGTNPIGNSGTLVAFLGSGADTVTGGSGASTIVGGSGNDVFGFVQGQAGGSEVILNFNASDNLAFKGYGYSLANPPAENITTFDGITSDVITLSDNTTITLVGIDHKIF
jgi:Ca2+-binding RTX toxin-like protein